MQKLLFYFWDGSLKMILTLCPFFGWSPPVKYDTPVLLLWVGKLWQWGVCSLCWGHITHEGGGRIWTHAESDSRACTLWNMLFLEMNLTRNDDWSNIGQKMKGGELSRWIGPGNFSKMEGDQAGKRRTCWVWDAFRTLMWASGTQNLTPVKFSYKTTNVTYLNAKENFGMI